MKTKIEYSKFEEAVKQIEGSYLKTTMFLSLLTDIKDIEIVVFIAGGLEETKSDPDKSFDEKAYEYREDENNLVTMLKELCTNKQAHMNIPFFLDKDIAIHNNYKKKKIKVYHLGFGDTFDIQTL